MTFSVLIATYKRPNLLLACLRSLLSQERQPDEIIVVVEKQDQETRGFLDCLLAEPFSTVPFRVGVTPKPCIPTAENLGLSMATSDVVCFIDDDAEASPDWLRRIEGRYLENNNLGAVGGQDIIYCADQPIPESSHTTSTVGQWTWYGRPHGNHHKVAPQPLYVDFLKGCNMSVLRRLVPTGIDPRITRRTHWEEDLCFNIRRQRKQVLFDPLIQVRHFPAPRPESSRHELTMPIPVYTAINFNYALVRLKYLRSWRKAAFLLYTFLIGDLDSVGLLQTVRQYHQNRAKGWWRVWWWSTGAKIRALRAWLRQGPIR